MLQPSLINDWLDQRPDSSLRIVSVCARQGHDLIGALAPRLDADRVCADLIEYDPRNVAAARMGITAAGLNGISATQADAGDFAAYRTAPLPIWSFSLAPSAPVRDADDGQASPWLFSVISWLRQQDVHQEPRASPESTLDKSPASAGPH